jgi:hypothetical protein
MDALQEKNQPPLLFLIDDFPRDQQPGTPDRQPGYVQLIGATG